MSRICETHVCAFTHTQFTWKYCICFLSIECNDQSFRLTFIDLVFFYGKATTVFNTTIVGTSSDSRLGTQLLLQSSSSYLLSSALLIGVHFISFGYNCCPSSNNAASIHVHVYVLTVSNSCRVQLISSIYVWFCDVA